MNTPFFSNSVCLVSLSFCSINHPHVISLAVNANVWMLNPKVGAEILPKKGWLDYEIQNISRLEIQAIYQKRANQGVSRGEVQSKSKKLCKIQIYSKCFEPNFQEKGIKRRLSIWHRRGGKSDFYNQGKTMRHRWEWTRHRWYTIRQEICHKHCPIKCVFMHLSCCDVNDIQVFLPTDQHLGKQMLCLTFK